MAGGVVTGKCRGVNGKWRVTGKLDGSDWQVEGSDWLM